MSRWRPAGFGPGAASERSHRHDLAVSQSSAAQPGPPSPPSGGPSRGERTDQNQRDRQLATAGFILGGSFFLTAVGGLVDAVDVIHTYYSAGLGVGHGFLLLGALATVAAGYNLGRAFLEDGRGRAERLRRAGLIYAGASLSLLIGASVLAGDYVAHHFPGTFSASWLVTAFAAAVGGAGGALFASAFDPQAEALEVRRAPKIGGSAGLAAAAALLSGISTTLLLVAYSEHYLPGGLAGGLGVETAGHFVLAGALVIAAAAFLPWRFRSADPSASYLLDRDALLTLAAVIGAAAYLLIFAGGAMQASDANVLSTGAGSASTWLRTGQALGWSAGLAWAALGLYRSGRRLLPSATPGL
jgi:MFS family permease